MSAPRERPPAREPAGSDSHTYPQPGDDTPGAPPALEAPQALDVTTSPVDEEAPPTAASTTGLRRASTASLIASVAMAAALTGICVVIWRGRRAARR